MIEFSDSGLVSLMGGKLTSFRKMGEETVDKILKHTKSIETKYETGQTLNFQLIGSYSKVEVEHGLKQNYSELYKKYEDELVFHYNVPRDVAKHLVEMHGTSALRVVQMSPLNSDQHKYNCTRLHPDYPFIKGETIFAMRYELCEKPNDILCRRMPIAILNKKVAEELLPEIVEIMAKEKKWSSS